MSQLAGIVGGVVNVGNAITSGSAMEEHIQHIQDAHTFKTINPRVTPEHPDGTHEVLSLLALLVQKYQSNNTGTKVPVHTDT
jgi:hypothetical protein